MNSAVTHESKVKSAACHACGGVTKVFFTPFNQRSMTSDGQPFAHSAPVLVCTHCGLLQKHASQQWLDNVDDIYAGYASQNIAQGRDAIVNGRTRSAVILENVAPFLPESGKLLDIGTGSGVFLEAARDHTQLTLCAQDINDNHASQLQAIGVEHTYFGDLADVDGQFDVITAIHVIEHVIDIESFYQQISRLLTPNGVFIAQVPQSNQNIFDLLIYDHLWHFTHYSVHQLLTPFFASVWFPMQLFKEITVMCSKQALTIDNENLVALDNLHLDNNLPDVARINRMLDIAMTYREIAVFGSGPNSVYMTNVLADKVTCIIDDDPLKVGQTLLGKPIIASQDVASDLPVVIPFPTHQARDIASRWDAQYVIF